MELNQRVSVVCSLLLAALCPVQAMYSSEGERVQLIQKISTAETKGAVEKWLVQVEDVMLRSVRDVVARSRLVRSCHLFGFFWFCACMS